MGDRLRAGIPSRYVTSQLRQLSLAFLQGQVSASVGVRAGMSALSGGGNQGRLNQWAHWARAQSPRILFFLRGPTGQLAL